MSHLGHVWIYTAGFAPHILGFATRCVELAMVEDEKKLIDPKFPFRVTDDQWAAVLDLRDKLKKDDSFKCQAISVKSLVDWPPKGVPIHSCRTLASNFGLLHLVVPYLNKTLAIKRVHCLQWILETVVAIRWKAWLGTWGVMGCDGV